MFKFLANTLCISVLIILLTHQTNSSCLQNDTYIRKYNVLSLISLTSAENRRYDMTSIVLGIRFQNEYTRKIVLRSKEFGFITVDVCNDESMLITAILDVLTASPGVFAVYSVMSFKLTRMAAYMLLYYKIPYFAFVDEEMYPIQLYEAPSNNVFYRDVYPKVDGFIEDIKNAELYYLYVCNGTVDCFAPRIYADEFKVYKTVCIKEKFLNVQNSTDLKTCDGNCRT